MLQAAGSRWFAVHISLALGVLLILATLGSARAPEAAEEISTLEIGRLTSDVTIDGDLSDAAWSDASRLETWYETNPGDNVVPQVDNVGYLAYDDQFLYVGLDFADPEPSRIRAPLGDRDNVPPHTDYGGLIVDANGDGTTAQMFLANPRGIQYDALSSDVAGEDSAPDFFWESAAQVTVTGWSLELKIPFSSLRYSDAADQTWNLMLYRNRPRDYRYQIFSTRLPRESSCFICNAASVAGLRDLPTGSHWVAAPYVSGAHRERANGGAGSSLDDRSTESELGLDVRWLPSPDTVIDLTFNPDFSQIESDTAQLGTNERFALFFEEKRPFFLEGADLFDTEIPALYTRTFTSPRWGLRSTGKFRKSSYTVLVGEDRGGGSVILPGSQGSSLARQDFESLVAVGRLRRELGNDGLVSVIYSGREIDGGGSNRLVGPDLRWRFGPSDEVTAQVLASWSDTPERPDLAEEWDGRSLSGTAADIWWSHNAEKVDWFVEYEGASEGFRADNGFVPQVGYHQAFAESGYTFRPKTSRVKRLRVYTFGSRTEGRDGEFLESFISSGFGFDGPWNSFVRMRGSFERVRTGGQTFDRNRAVYTFDVRPSRRVSRIRIDGDYGDQIDFVEHRKGTGGSIALLSNLRFTDHLELQFDAVREWLDLDRGPVHGRLFTAELARLKAVYNFNARSYLRWIGQWTETERTTDLYDTTVQATDADLTGSLLFAYKINWQTVLFVGFGEDREETVAGSQEPIRRTAFIKFSYAFRH